MAKAQDEANDIAEMIKYIQETEGDTIVRPGIGGDSSDGRSSSQKPDIRIDSSIASEFNVNSFLIVDMEDEQRAMKRNARKTLTEMVKHVVPASAMNDKYILDKIEQDVVTLSKLYWQRKSTEMMQYSIMESVGRGMNQPRMYEVFGQLGTKIQDISRQIVEMEHAIRKSYIDIKMETDARVSEEADAKDRAIAQEESPKLLSSKDRILQAKTQFQEKLVEAVGIGDSIEDQ